MPNEIQVRVLTELGLRGEEVTAILRAHLSGKPNAKCSKEKLQQPISRKMRRHRSRRQLTTLRNHLEHSKKAIWFLMTEK